MTKQLLLVIVSLFGFACSAMPDPGPQISVSAEFTDAQRSAIEQAVEEWNMALGLRMQTTRGECDCVHIVIDNSILQTMHRLGSTHLESGHPERARVRLAVSGTLGSVHAEDFDLRTIALHEIGHVLENWNGASRLGGCDGEGHTECGEGASVMSSRASLTPKHLSAADVDLVSEGMQ
jgi:hypothetical protein